MKKVLVTMALVLVTLGVVNAQTYKPGVGSFGIETGVTITNFSLQDFQLKGSYSLTEKIGVRLGFEFGLSTDKFDNGENSPVNQTIKLTETRFMFVPGITYSFAGTERLAPYAGAEFGFGTTSHKEVEEIGTITTTTKNGNDNFNAIRFNVFTGFNYYFAQNLYVGAEVGLGFTNQSFKKVSIETTGIPTTESKESRSEFDFTPYCNPAIRLGWNF